MKLLIQGCGYIGEVHLKSIVNYKLCDVALCEVNEDRLSSLAATYGIKEIYHSLDDALEHQFDGVVICTPNFAHKTDLEKCVKVGMDVFLRKTDQRVCHHGKRNR
ncbi:MAG: Gfo/Idh/MocA family oxidoreductase [Flexilinea sp.]